MSRHLLYSEYTLKNKSIDEMLDDIMEIQNEIIEEIELNQQERMEIEVEINDLKERLELTKRVRDKLWEEFKKQNEELKNWKSIYNFVINNIK